MTPRLNILVGLLESKLKFIDVDDKNSLAYFLGHGPRTGRAGGAGLAHGRLGPRPGTGDRLAAAARGGHAVVAAAVQPLARPSAGRQAGAVGRLHRSGHAGAQTRADARRPGAVFRGGPGGGRWHGRHRAGAPPAGLVRSMSGAPHPSRLVRGLLWLAGSAALVLGLIGVVLPGLPTALRVRWPRPATPRPRRACTPGC